MFWSFIPILLHRNFKGGMTTVTLLESSFWTFYNNYTKNFGKCQLFNSSNFLNHKTHFTQQPDSNRHIILLQRIVLTTLTILEVWIAVCVFIGCGGGIRTHARLPLTESKSVALPLGDSTINWWGEGRGSNSLLQSHNLPCYRYTTDTIN